MKKTKILFLTAAVIMILGLAGCGNTKIDLMDYVTVVFSGVDGQGKAVYNVDTVKLEQDLAGDTDGQISIDEFEKIRWISQFETTISYQLDKETGLSNGDEVTVSVTCDEEFAKENKVTVSESQKTFKVDGLKEPIEVDAFSEDIFNTKNGVILEYSGTSTYTELKIQNKCTGEPNSMITYRADKEFDIKNGDQIKITAELPKDAADEGYILKETEKTITVEGLNSYVDNLSQINEENRTELISKLEKAFSAETERRVRFHDSQGTELDMSTDSTTFSNFTLSEDTYESAKKEFTIIPFTVDTTGSYYWWGREYFENQTEKTFTGANGFIVAKYLTIDSNGNLVDDNNVYFEVGGIYEDKSKMEADINADYGV